jgi:thiol:disulfide interchange protein DsbA
MEFPMLQRLLVATVLLLAAPLVLAADFVAGQDYFPIDPPQPTASGDKIEVIEVFVDSSGLRSTRLCA